MESWSGLKAAEKAKIIQFAIKNGISDINQIRDTFNIYARDGHIHEGTKSDSKLHIPTREEYITQKLDSIQNAALEASRRKTQAQTTPVYAKDVYGQKYVTDVVLKGYVEDARNQVERLKAQERFRAKKNNSPEFIQGNTNTAYQSVRLAEAEKSLETAEKMLSGEIKYDGPTLSNCIANLSEFFPHGLPYGNETFSNNPKKYGFSLIDTWDVKPGDLVQKVDYSGRVHVPHHAMIYNGIDSKGEPTFNYSNGGMPYTIPNEFTGKVDTVGGYGVGKYYPDAVAKDKEHLWDVNVYRYTGTPQDSAMWTNEWLQKYGTGAEFSSGGKIHIAPSKRGTFTAAASKHGKSVQAFAAQVLAHKENYSPAMVKKANFARNARKWHKGADGMYLDTDANTRTYNDALDYFTQLGFRGKNASDLALQYAADNMQYDAGVLPEVTITPNVQKRVVIDNGTKNVHYAPHTAPVQESTESKIAAGMIGIPMAATGAGILGSYIGGADAGNALGETISFLKTPVGRAVAKKTGIDMGLSILGGEAVNDLSEIFTQNTIGQNIANATNNVPYIQDVPYGIRETIGDFVNPGYFISGPLGRLSNTASAKLANFDIQNVASAFKNNKFYPKLKRAYDRSYLGVSQKLKKGYKDLINKNSEVEQAYRNVSSAKETFRKQNTFNISPAIEAPTKQLQLEFKNPFTGEVTRDFIPLFEPRASVDLEPINLDISGDARLRKVSTIYGESLRGRNPNSAISAEIKKYTGQLENMIGNDGVIVGSTSLYKDNIIAGTPGDVEFITTRGRLKSLKNKLGATKVRDLVGVPGENIAGENLIGGSGDIEVIEQTLSGKAKGQTALEFYRIIDPEGYQKILETSVKRGKDVYELPLPISAEDLLKKIQADKSLVTKKTILDFLGSAKSKHADRARAFITNGDTQTVTSSLHEMRRSLFGKQEKSLQELYPNMRFDDVEANKEFLRYVGMPERYATNPEIIRNIVDYFDLSESVTRSSVKNALKVNQATASGAGGGGNYLRASSVGGGRIFGDYTIVMGNTLTTNNNLVHTPMDLVTAYKNSSELYKPLEADVVDILEKLTGRRFANLEDISRYTSYTRCNRSIKSLSKQFSDIADILGIRGMRTDGYNDTYFGNLSLREDMPQNMVYSKHDSSPLEVGGWWQKRAIERTTSIDYLQNNDLGEYSVYIPDKYKTNGVFDNEKFQKAVGKLREETNELIKKAAKGSKELDRLRARNLLLNELKDKKENALDLVAYILLTLNIAGVVGTGAYAFVGSDAYDNMLEGFENIGNKIKSNIENKPTPRGSKTTDESEIEQHEHSTGGPLYLYPFSFQKNPSRRTPVVRYADGGDMFTPNENIQNVQMWLNKGTRFQKQRPGTVNIQDITDKLNPFGADNQYVWDDAEHNSYSAFRRNPDYRESVIPKVEANISQLSVNPVTVPKINVSIPKPSLLQKRATNLNWVPEEIAFNPAFGYETFHLENSPYYGIKYYSIPGAANAGEGSYAVLDSTVMGIPIQELNNRIFDYRTKNGGWNSFSTPD